MVKSLVNEFLAKNLVSEFLVKHLVNEIRLDAREKAAFAHVDFLERDRARHPFACSGLTFRV